MGKLQLNSGFHSDQSGITLIELVIVIAIIGMLAGLALPAFQDYAHKGRVADAAITLTKYATQIEEKYLESRRYGTDNGQCNVLVDDSIYFDFSCILPEGNEQQFLLTAVSKSGFSQNKNLELRIDHQGNRTSKLKIGSNDTQEFNCWLLSLSGECR